MKTKAFIYLAAMAMFLLPSSVEAASVATQGELNEAIASAEENSTVEITAAGIYTLPNVPQNITIKGTVDNVMFSHTGNGNIASIPNGATFENVSFTFGTEYYHGFQHPGKITMKNCTLNGKLFSYKDMDFENCTFNAPNDDYSLWLYGDEATINFTDCVFNGTGRFLLLYQDEAGIKYVNATGCKFKNQGNSNKAAFNIKASCVGKLNITQEYHVVISNCTTEGSFPEVSESNTLVVFNSLVQVDDINTSYPDKNTIELDGTLIWKNNAKVVPTSKIGDKEYATLKDAVAAVPNDGTETVITMITDETINVATDAVTIAAGQNIVLELNGKEITGFCESGTASALITNNGTLTIQDVTDTANDGSGDGKIYAGANPAWIYEGGNDYSGSFASNLIANRGKLTIKSGYLESTTSGSAAYVIDNYTNGDVVINGGHLYNYHTSAIRLFCNSTTNNNSVTVNGGIIEGYCPIWVQGASKNDEIKGILTINGGTFITTEKAVVNGTKLLADGSSPLYLYQGNANMTLNINGGTFNTNVAIYGNANSTITGGTFNGYVYFANSGTVSVTGGEFNDYCEAYYHPNNDFINGSNLAVRYWYNYEEEGETYLDVYYFNFERVFTKGWLANGENIDLICDATMVKDITCGLTGGTFNMNFGDYTLTRGEYNILLHTGVSVVTDKEVDGLFAAADNGSVIYKKANGNGTYTYSAIPTTVTITNEAGYKTFCSPVDVDFSSWTKIKAFVAVGYENDEVIFRQLTKAAAGEGIVLIGKQNDSETLITATENVETTEDNLLVGVLTDTFLTQTEGNYTNYVIGENDDVWAFYKVVEEGGTLAAGKSYLRLENATGARINIRFEETTGVETVSNVELSTHKTYDLQGRRVSNPTKGLYLVNGKKISIK